MRYRVLFCLGSVALAAKVAAQSAVDVKRPEERQKARQAVVKEQEKRAQRTSIIEFRGNQAFDEKALRAIVSEQIEQGIDGLVPAGTTGESASLSHDEYKQLLLKDKDQLARNLAKKLLAYSTGAPPTPLDDPEIDSIISRVREKGYGFRSLVHEIVQSSLFQSK